MSASMMNICRLRILQYCMVLHLIAVCPSSFEHQYTLLPRDVHKILDKACFIADLRPLTDESKSVPEASLFSQLTAIYDEDEHVVIGSIELDNFTWPPGARLKIKQRYSRIMLLDRIEPLDVLLFRRRVKDRTCLLLPTHAQRDAVAEVYHGPLAVDALVDYINSNCGAYRTSSGQISHLGLQRKHILDNLFHVRSVSDVNMKHIYGSRDSENRPTLNKSFVWDWPNDRMYSISGDHREPTCRAYVSRHEICDGSPKNVLFCPRAKNKHLKSFKSRGLKERQDRKTIEVPECERVSSPLTENEFFHKYLKRSRPFILANITRTWPAYQIWTNSFFRQKFGQNRVHIKLTPKGDFEGVENIKLWDNYETFSIPDEVRKHFKSPDLVVVRPAGANMKLSEFLDIINNTAHESPPEKSLSAYLEYTSLSASMPGVERDIHEPKFASKLLKKLHLNIWLSDGNTLGRLHFDQFDNLLCQISGRKQVILFEPHTNHKMYEGHIQQATLSYNQHTGEFSRRNLEDSTSMVMSPVDLLKPDFKRFPRFAEMHPLNCTLNEGDILYMPAFWWHEVQSFPSPTQHRNLAVNFWYEPFLTREFPCPECVLDINPMYHHLLH